MSSNRPARVSEEIKRAVCDIIKNDLRDPRLPELLSVLDVAVSNDLSHARVYYAVLSGHGDPKEVRKALKGASGFIRRELGSRLRLRQTPELHFEQDTSVDRAIALNRLIDDTVRGGSGRDGAELGGSGGGADRDGAGRDGADRDGAGRNCAEKEF